MPVFMVEGGMGVMAMEAPTKRAALSYVKRRYGTCCAPFKAREASKPDLADHLGSGCMFFEADGGVMPKDRAFALAGKPLPNSH